MNKKLIIGIVVASLAGIPALLICAFVIWPPDIFTGARHTIATLTLTNGDSFTVVQYWNRTDFYSTELHHRSRDGHITVDTLDGDDVKSWNVPIAVDEQRRTVTVTLTGHRQRTVSF
jgi:hypothetical protein